jgi:hypothetical protein
MHSTTWTQRQKCNITSIINVIIAHNQNRASSQLSSATLK